MAGSSLCHSSFLMLHKSFFMVTPLHALQEVPLGMHLIGNSWACCQEPLTISRNGLCLKNIWMATKALSQSLRRYVYRTSNDQMFQVQAAALHSLASACISTSFLVSLAPTSAIVPADRRTPLYFLWLKLLVILARGDSDKKVLLQRIRLKTGRMGKNRKGPSRKKRSVFSGARTGESKEKRWVDTGVSGLSGVRPQWDGCGSVCYSWGSLRAWEGAGGSRG